MQVLYTIVKKLAIPRQVVKLQQLPMTVPPKLANSNECDGVLVTDNVSGSNQLMRLLNLNIGSVLTELMSLGNEVHIKFVHNLVMDGCPVDLSVFADVGMGKLNSSAGLLNNLEFSCITRRLNLGYTRKELLKYSTGNLSSLERCSDIRDVQLETPKRGSSPEMYILSQTF